MELRRGDAGTWAGSEELLAGCFHSTPSDIRELRVRADRFPIDLDALGFRNRDVFGCGGNRHWFARSMSLTPEMRRIALKITPALPADAAVEVEGMFEIS